MTWSIVVISAALLWLMYETHWMTIRLYSGRNVLMRLIQTMIAIYVGVNLFPSEGEKNDL
jgi:hypothetical protein